jgi:hypothetical protein
MRKLLPPSGKPHYRFVVAIAGIIALAFLTMAAVALIFPEGDTSASTDPTADALPAGGAVPADPAPPGDQPTTKAPPGDLPAPVAGKLSAAYRVLPEGTWDAGFQAEVAISNATGSPQSWRVRLRYPDAVMGLVSSSMVGQPEPTVRLTDDGVIFTGTAALPPRQTARLQFQFAKLRDGAFAPLECSVNGRRCAVA